MSGHNRPRDTILFIHGLGRTRRAMWPLALRARAKGYRVGTWGYASRAASIEVHANALKEKLVYECEKNREGQIHIVTHSLGGRVVRNLFERHAADQFPSLGRVVMIAPPHAGSEVIDYGIAYGLFRMVFGPVVHELGTTAAYPKLPDGAPDVGVIAGTRSQWSLSLLFTRVNDGKVAVESAKIIGMRDFVAVPFTHTGILWKKQVADLVLSFIEQGTFTPP